ncbi:MAG: Holliday junction resolvase RuvX [Candidatus Zixiibacteriota bacterium]
MIDTSGAAPFTSHRMTPPNRTVLAIDYGAKRIGLARSDPTGTIATALTTLEVSSDRDALKQLSKIIDEIEPTALIIGYPISLSGRQGPACRKVDEFIKQLESIYNGPIHKVDERLTSVAAQRVIHEHGRKSGQDKKRVDRLAAVLILQQFLDSEKNTT